MPDYITREELEQRLQEFVCQGDQQTIMVQQTPGGQLLSSIQAIGGDGGGEAKYISIAYDSDEEEFTVTIDGMPFSTISSTAYPRLASLDSSLVFDLPAQSRNVFLIACTQKSGTNSLSTGAEIRWLGDVDGSDAATQALESDSILYGTPVFQIYLTSDGRSSITSQITGDDRAPISSPGPPPEVYVHTDATPSPHTDATPSPTITISNISNPQKPGSVIINNPLSYTPPVDDALILGWNDGGDNVTLDFEDNKFDYDQYKVIASVKIDASNNVINAEYSFTYDNAPIPKFGYTGTAPASATLTIQDGVIIAVS